MANEIQLYLVVYDFPYDPEMVTEAIGLVPSRIWRCGEKKLNSTDVFLENGWKLRIGVESNCDLETQLEYLVQLIEPVLPALAKIRESARIEISCLVFARDYIPSIHFSPSAIRVIAEIGAEIDVDFYPMLSVEI